MGKTYKFKQDELRIRRNTKKIKQLHVEIKELFAEFGV